ncbi:MAG: cell division protein FtsB [Proteobacteria bacterium]|nr:cell division protein FtsB [Pseudomonadota bacterium]
METRQTLKYVNIALLSTFLILQFALWTGDKNLFDLYHLNNSKEQTELEIVQLTQRNDKFLAEVLDLKNGGQAVETLARQELGFIKEGETFYQVITE